jgi:hypothetical protein
MTTKGDAFRRAGPQSQCASARVSKLATPFPLRWLPKSELIEAEFAGLSLYANAVVKLLSVNTEMNFYLRQ